MATSAFGTTTAAQVFNDNDNQIARSIELLPKAKELAQNAKKIRAITATKGSDLR